MKSDVLDDLQIRLAQLGRAHTPADVAGALRASGEVVTDQSLLEAMELLRRNSIGAGPLDDLLHEPGVTDVLVNGACGVYVDRGHGLELSEVTFSSDDEVRRLAIRLAASAGRRLDDAQPWVDGRLPDGTRLHAILAPLAWPGTLISLRIPARVSLSLTELAHTGSVIDPGLDVLRGLITRRVPFLVSGGTGSGKTTLLAALLAEVPDDERIVVVEDTAELQPQHPHCVRLEGRCSNTEGAGAITLTALVRQALRMRPDRVILGEARGAEITDLLTAFNTGHEGGCGTIHANSVEDVPARLEALAALGGVRRDACHAQVASALKAVVHVRRRASGRREVHQIAVFRRGDDGLVSTQVGLTMDAGTATTGPAWWELARLAGVRA